MKLTIEIEMDNDAFGSLNGIETARILREYANIIFGFSLLPGDDTRLIDTNGNKIGYARIEE